MPQIDGKIAVHDQEIQYDDRHLVELVLQGDTRSIADFLKKNCARQFDYLNRTRLLELNLNTDDLINDFFLFLQEDNWAKLRAFRFESKLQTWINLVASRYLTKKYHFELQEIRSRKAPIDEIKSFTDEDPVKKAIAGELYEAIAMLKETNDRTVLMMTLQGYSTEEICKHMSMTATNIYTIKSRAIVKLRKLLNA